MSNNNYIEQVGAYLDNELSATEVANFEAELASNPELAREVAFQKDIIEGIKQNRIDALKVRLDGIDVSGLSGSSGSLGGFSKFAAGVLLVGAAGFGLFKFMQPASEEIQTLPELEVQSEEKSEDVSNTSDDSSPNIAEEKSEGQNESKPVVEESEHSDAENHASDLVREDNGSQATKIGEEKTPNSPAVPEPMDVFEPVGDIEEHEDDLELPQTNLGQSETRVESALEIEIVSDRKKYSFHYQVLDGRLILYGNFDAEPYEILEINVNTSTETFLYFKDSYYEIDKENTDILPLQTVQSTQLKRELEKIRNKEP